MKLHESVRMIGNLVASALFALIAMAAPAAAQNGTFTASASSGAAGSAVTVTSVTPCTLPAGVTGSPLVRVSLSRGSTVLGTASITVSASGSWSGTLTVNTGATDGTAQLSAFCLASPQAEGAVLAYDPLPFTVGTSELARTGAPSTSAFAWGTTLLLFGLVLAGTSRVIQGRVVRCRS
jgi:hypothetical protein